MTTFKPQFNHYTLFLTATFYSSCDKTFADNHKSPKVVRIQRRTECACAPNRGHVRLRWGVCIRSAGAFSRDGAATILVAFWSSVLNLHHHHHPLPDPTSPLCISEHFRALRATSIILCIWCAQRSDLQWSWLDSGKQWRVLRKFQQRRRHEQPLCGRILRCSWRTLESICDDLAAKPLWKYSSST